jgi:peptidoglycan/LPS O-acetylase OafA/YrhL
VLGAIVAASFVAINSLAPIIEPALARLAGPIRYLAAYTFAMYLLHVPLLHFFAAIYGRQVVLNLASTTLAIFAIGSATERYRPHLARALRDGYALIGTRVTAARASLQ